MLLLVVTFCVAFYNFVVGNRIHFKYGTQIDHSKSQHTDDKLSLKWAWSFHVIYFKFQGPKHTSVITKAKNDVSPLNGRGYDNVTCSKIMPFDVMQRVAQVRQRQRSYLWYNTGLWQTDRETDITHDDSIYRTSAAACGKIASRFPVRPSYTLSPIWASLSELAPSAVPYHFKPCRRLCLSGNARNCPEMAGI